MQAKDSGLSATPAILYRVQSLSIRPHERFQQVDSGSSVRRRLSCFAKKLHTFSDKIKTLSSQNSVFLSELIRTFPEQRFKACTKWLKRFERTTQILIENIQNLFKENFESIQQRSQTLTKRLMVKGFCDLVGRRGRSNSTPGGCRCITTLPTSLTFYQVLAMVFAGKPQKGSKGCQSECLADFTCYRHVCLGVQHE